MASKRRPGTRLAARSAALTAGVRQASEKSPCGQAQPSSVAKLRLSACRLARSSSKWAATRPSSRVSASASRRGARRSRTLRRCTVAAAPRSWLSAHSTLACTEPAPLLSSNGRSMCRRSVCTSACGRLSSTLPRQVRQSPGRVSVGPVVLPSNSRVSTSGCAKSAWSAIDWPHSRGGVASNCTSWRRPAKPGPLRSVRLTACRSSGGAARCSSIQRTWPLMMRTRLWLKSQSAPPEELASPWLETGSPATNNWPRASRRTSSCGAWMSR